MNGPISRAVSSCKDYGKVRVQFASAMSHRPAMRAGAHPHISDESSEVGAPFVQNSDRYIASIGCDHLVSARLKNILGREQNQRLVLARRSNTESVTG